MSESADTLSIILSTVRESMERAGVANDPGFDDALADAELRARRILGGARHYIQRLPALEALVAVELLPANLTVEQMVERTGMSKTTVRRMLAESKRRRSKPAANT